MTKLYFMMGMARSGKSTYVNKWIKEDSNRVVVSSDDIRYAMHGNRYSSFAETMVFSVKHIMIRALLRRGMTVLVDGTHTSKISIERILEIDSTAKPILINTPKEICIERALLTNQADLIPTIERQNKNLQEIFSLAEHPLYALQLHVELIKKEIKDRWWGSDSMPNFVV